MSSHLSYQTADTLTLCRHKTNLEYKLAMGNESFFSNLIFIHNLKSIFLQLGLFSKFKKTIFINLIFFHNWTNDFWPTWFFQNLRNYFLHTWIFKKSICMWWALEIFPNLEKCEWIFDKIPEFWEKGEEAWF